MATPLDEATELLQTMIRNQCVNDGRPRGAKCKIVVAATKVVRAELAKKAVPA